MTIQEKIDIDRTFGTLGGDVSAIVITDLQGTKFCESLRMLNSYDDFVRYQQYMSTDGFSFIDTILNRFSRPIDESVKLCIDSNEYNKFMSLPYTNDMKISQFGYKIMIEIMYSTLNEHTKHYVNQYILRRLISFKEWYHSGLARAVYQVLDESLNVSDYIMDTCHSQFREYMDKYHG